MGDCHLHRDSLEQSIALGNRRLCGRLSYLTPQALPMALWAAEMPDSE
jgi:hypothetical protein